MIQPTELGLNNWVYSIQLAKEVQIATIQEDSVTFVGEVTWDYNDYDSIEPITLSEETLMKCGFKKDGDYHYYINGFLIWKPADFFIHDKTGTIIENLHHLQNLVFDLLNKTQLIYTP